MKKLLNRLFVLIILQGLVAPMLFLTQAIDFLDGKWFQEKSTLQWDTKIPAGIVGKTIHYITFTKGTPLSEIPLKISQKRKEVGLSPDIPPTEQKEFFQNLPWKTAKAAFLKSPLPGRVVHMNVQPGQQIVAGECLCTIECMKMYFEIRTEHDETGSRHGEIRNIFFEVGDMVESGSTLISLVSSDPDWEDINQGKIWENKDLLLFLFSWGTKPSPTPPHVSPPSQEEETSYTPFLENKEVMILLYPWMTKAPPIPPNIPSSNKETKNGTWNRLFGKDSFLQDLKKHNIPFLNIQGSMLQMAHPVPKTRHDNNDHNNSNTQVALERVREHSTVWQSIEALHQKESGGKEPQDVKFKDISGTSTFVWFHWFCGLIILNKLALALKSLSDNLLRRIRLRKYTFIVSVFPRTAYVCTTSCNTYLLIKKQTGTNTNRKYSIKWQVA